MFFNFASMILDFLSSDSINDSISLTLNSFSSWLFCSIYYEITFLTPKFLSKILRRGELHSKMILDYSFFYTMILGFCCFVSLCGGAGGSYPSDQHETPLHPFTIKFLSVVNISILKLYAYIKINATIV